MKIFKLNKNHEFQEVYTKGAFFANRQLVIYLLQNNKGYNRFGITAGKKIGKSVARNRIKRLIREAVRYNADKLKTGYDFVILAREGSKGESFIQIEKSFLHIIKKYRLLKENHQEN